MNVNTEYCEELGLDVKLVESAVRRLSKAARELEEMGLTVFGGAGSGTVRMMSHDPGKVLANLDGRFDGGDGGVERWQ
jgi:hypothetical protein